MEKVVSDGILFKFASNLLMLVDKFLAAVDKTRNCAASTVPTIDDTLVVNVLREDDKSLKDLSKLSALATGSTVPLLASPNCILFELIMKREFLDPGSPTFMCTSPPVDTAKSFLDKRNRLSSLALNTSRPEVSITWSLLYFEKFSGLFTLSFLLPVLKPFL